MKSIILNLLILYKTNYTIEGTLIILSYLNICVEIVNNTLSKFKDNYKSLKLEFFRK
ncbi:hypothetical protein NBRC111452_2129 [Companilactobacillus farciminis]|nr:hypothetical protein NBRC111452_2129 [Companilactobacillus farciminis]